jgi:hypothetical protein
MAKGQVRSNKEAKKPKKAAIQASAAATVSNLMKGSSVPVSLPKAKAHKPG